MTRVASYAVGALIGIAALLAYLELVQGVGFPDGYASPLAIAERQLAWIFITQSALVVVGLVVFANAASRGRKLAVLAAYTAASLIIIAIDVYYRGHLDAGGGG